MFHSTTMRTEIRNVALRIEGRFDKIEYMIGKKLDRVMERLDDEPGDRADRGIGR